MEHYVSREVKSHSTGRKIPSFMNSKSNHRNQNNPPLDHLMGRFNSVQHI